MDSKALLGNMANQLGIAPQYQANKPVVDQVAGAVEQNAQVNRDQQWQEASSPQNMNKVKTQLNQQYLQRIKQEGR